MGLFFIITWLNFYRVTAYCPGQCCCGPHAAGITASGHVIQPDDKFVAADKSILFGTLVIIPNYNNNQPVPVLDRGGAIHGNRMDVYFDTHKEALRWGVQWLPIQFQ